MLDVPSSTGIAREDSIPTLIELTYEGEVWRVDLWDVDRLDNAGFLSFEASLQAVFTDVSDGKIDIALLR